MKHTLRLTAILTAFVLLLSGCTDTTVTADPSPSPTPTVASYSGLEVEIIPAPEDVDFGLIEASYTADGSTTVTLGEIAGDTDALNPTGIRATYDSLNYNAVELLFDAEFPVAFSAKQYTNGEVVDDGGILTLEAGGIVEKYNADGTWTRAEFAELRTPIPHDPYRGTSRLDKDEFPISKDGAVFLALPFEAPGVYRYTIYFRECIDATDENRTTGEELYELSMIFNIPESDKLFDVVAVSSLEEQEIIFGENTGKTGYRLSTLVRVNAADRLEAVSLAPAYCLTEESTVERLEGDAWVAIPDGLYKHESDYPMYSGGAAEFGNWFLTTNSIDGIYFPELRGEYRLTGTFVDNDKLYELPLYFNFGE